MNKGQIRAVLLPRNFTQTSPLLYERRLFGLFSVCGNGKTELCGGLDFIYNPS